MKLRIFITENILKASAYCGFYPDGSMIKNKNIEVGKNCAIAKAIVNLFGQRANTGLGAIYIERENSFDYSAVIPLPLEASQFISEFDDLTPSERINMTPFSFEVEVPQTVIDELGLEWMQGVVAKTPELELV